jgi:hypothetical protein
MTMGGATENSAMWDRSSAVAERVEALLRQMTPEKIDLVTGDLLRLRLLQRPDRAGGDPSRQFVAGRPTLHNHRRAMMWDDGRRSGERARSEGVPTDPMIAAP